MTITEYLTTNYRPDREYIDGHLVERNVGNLDHSRLQGETLLHLAGYRKTIGLWAFPEWRVQVKPTRYRVPDITVVRGRPGEQIRTQPPFLCIEVLSTEDSMSSMQERIDDYLDFGVKNIWIIDPGRRKGFCADSTGIHEAADGVLRTRDESVDMDLDAMW